MTTIVAVKKRVLVRDLAILDADSATITPGANDVVRVKIGRMGSTPLLDLDSAQASTNGSTVTANHPSSGLNRLEIKSTDMDLSPGVYTLELALYDNADGNIKHVDHQVFVVINAMTGDVGAS